MRGVKLLDMKSAKDPLQMLDLNETMDQLAITNSVRWYGHALRKHENNFLRRALDIEVKGIRKNGLPMETWIKIVVEQSRKHRLSARHANNR